MTRIFFHPDARLSLYQSDFLMIIGGFVDQYAGRCGSFFKILISAPTLFLKSSGPCPNIFENHPVLTRSF
jgi:hypothetical protein